MSKRDDDSQADMEVGMTTAERRRRRRRGGGLRVPSDNVPRRTNPPVVPPVPEDPSLAMSIAYSFTSDASEPVPRVAPDSPSGRIAPTYAEPIAPELMQTVIDPVSAPIEQQDFEMKTREMSAVDLEALGLATDPNSLTTTNPNLPGLHVTRTSDLEIEVTGFEPNGANDSIPNIPKIIPSELSSGPVSPIAEKPYRKERQKTVALSEEDLEEVREAARAATDKPLFTPPPLTPAPPLAAKRPLSEESASAPEIDINELAERSAESSGEIEVDMGDEAVVSSAPAEPKRARPPSTPPPLASHAPVAPSAAPTNPGVAVSTNGPSAHPPSQTQPPPTVPHAHPPAVPHAHPPPPPPAAHHQKPPPPPTAKPHKDPPPIAAKESRPSVARTPSESKPPPRGKPWFVELFDEDYLRTLPFLTPQATQAEAEFVIDAMGLSPGAQVLDVGCGYGRHAMELAARGYHVVGLDMSTPLLVRGGEEAHRRNLQINFVRGDMRELDFEAQFDAAYCLFSTFGYFDDETNKKTVANIARALKPGGRVMIEILNRDYLITDLPTRVWWEGDGCVVLEEVELNYFSSRIQVNRSVVFDDGRQLEQEISVRAYSLHEVGKLMHAAGFRVLEVSGGYHTRGRFFGNQSRHIIVLAERKDTATG